MGLVHVLLLNKKKWYYILIRKVFECSKEQNAQNVLFCFVYTLYLALDRPKRYGTGA